MNKVVVVMVKPLEFLPPVMSLLQTLRLCGREPVFVGVRSASGTDFLEKNGFEARYVPYDSKLYINDSLASKVTHRIMRGLGFYKRRHELISIVADIAEQYGELTMWFAEIQSAALMGNAWERYGRPIVTIYELSDFNGSAWLGFSFRRFISAAVIVEPEQNRADEIHRYFHLPQVPKVVANKPGFHPRKLSGELPEIVRDVVKRAAGRPIFIYQGVWTEDRVEVGKFLETIAENRPNYCVLLMPGTPAVSRLAKKCDNVFQLEYIPPPNHLAVTSVASVGIAVYNASGRTVLQRKNALFCAPNKIYEYAGFGIPTLGNRVPGLIDTVERAGAGVCVDVNEKDILDGADKLINNIEQYKKSANKFFEDTDLVKQVGEVLREAEKA